MQQEVIAIKSAPGNQELGIVNNTAMNIGVQVPFQRNLSVHQQMNG